MSMTDPIADLLTRIRNAQQAGHAKTTVPGSGIKKQILGILRTNGFIKGFDVKPGTVGQEEVIIDLFPWVDENKVLTGLKRVSRPGRRVYVDRDEVPNVLNGLGIAIISTSRGVVTDNEARTLGVGGELLCEIW
ncbi:MAG: 30S ribosomal protein S8 [bacterium]|nr:30S ribosomal protein S8 [bacterium]